MSDPTNSPTIIWIALLIACDGTVIDLTEAHPMQGECAEQMCAAGILQEADPQHYTLTGDGMKLLQLIENLRDYSLGIN